MYQVDQGLMYHPSLDSIKKHGHGCGSRRHSPEIWYVFVQVWGGKLKGTLQLDMSYATIPVFGQQRRLYRETLMKYMVSSQEKPHNYPLYSAHSDLYSFIMYNNGDMEEQIAQLEEDTLDPKEGHEITREERKENVISEELPADF
jgi:hypothetical protein